VHGRAPQARRPWGPRREPAAQSLAPEGAAPPPPPPAGASESETSDQRSSSLNLRVSNLVDSVKVEGGLSGGREAESGGSVGGQDTRISKAAISKDGGLAAQMSRKGRRGDVKRDVSTALLLGQQAEQLLASECAAFRALLGISGDSLVSRSFALYDSLEEFTLENFPSSYHSWRSSGAQASAQLSVLCWAYAEFFLYVELFRISLRFRVVCLEIFLSSRVYSKRSSSLQTLRAGW
jgi:hypothetical protein